MQVSVIENVLKLNDEIAAINRERFEQAGVFVVDLLGAPGCGKTELIESTMIQLSDMLRIGVIAGDLATQRDGERLARHTRQVVQVNTGKTCHLEANHIHEALKSIDLNQLDLLFIENVGNLICPVGFDLGQAAKVGVFSVTGGDDKAAKHPAMVLEPKLLILNKIDLLSQVPFDLQVFRDDVKRLKPHAKLLELSALKFTGMEPWFKWLWQHIPASRRSSLSWKGDAPAPRGGAELEATV
jgi:hydrogenase nickel incorporation protein HypB